MARKRPSRRLSCKVGQERARSRSSRQFSWLTGRTVGAAGAETWLFTDHISLFFFKSFIFFCILCSPLHAPSGPCHNKRAKRRWASSLRSRAGADWRREREGEAAPGGKWFTYKKSKGRFENFSSRYIIHVCHSHHLRFSHKCLSSSVSNPFTMSGMGTWVLGIKNRIGDIKFTWRYDS